jgi:hypothetical protein
MQAEPPGPLSPGSVRGTPPNELNPRRRRSSGPADTAGRHDRNAGLPGGTVHQAARSTKRHGPRSPRARQRAAPLLAGRPCRTVARANGRRASGTSGRSARPAKPHDRPNRRRAEPHERPAGGHVLAGCAWRSPQRALLPGSDPVGRVISLVFVSAEACARTNPECWSRAGRRWAWWPGRSLLRAASRRPR